MDTVISSKSGFTIDHDFLIQMQKYYCPTDEQKADGNYETVQYSSFLELISDWEKHNNKK